MRGVLDLNRRHALLEDALIAQGAVDVVRPSLRSIVARALQTNPTGLIAAHDHPSGAAEPSEADRLLTRDLLAASGLLGVRVLDHVLTSESRRSERAMGILIVSGNLQIAKSPARRAARLGEPCDELSALHAARRHPAC